MSALDDAISAHMTHPAGAGFDPLTDSLAEQEALCTAPAALDSTPPRREGWETEAIRVPHPWLLYIAALLLGLFGFSVQG